MNPNDNQDYNPADDDNQGVVQLLAQGQESNTGTAQSPYINPVTDQGPEPEKAEVNESDGDSSVNDDLSVEEDVEDGEVDGMSDEDE